MECIISLIQITPKSNYINCPTTNPFENNLWKFIYNWADRQTRKPTKKQTEWKT